MNKQNMVSSRNRILFGHKKEWRADTCMKWDAKHLFLCLLPTCASSLEQHLFKAFVQLLIRLFNFLLSCKSSLYILDINFFSDNIICKNHLPFCGLPFCSIDNVFWCIKVFNFHEVQFMYFFLLLPVTLVSYPVHHCQIQYYKAFSPCFLLRVL